jgi:hypothetical protein
MQKLLLGYRDNMRVEVEPGVAIAAKTVADLRTLPTWPEGLVLNIHIDLDPRLSVVRVRRIHIFVCTKSIRSETCHTMNGDKKRIFKAWPRANGKSIPAIQGP